MEDWTRAGLLHEINHVLERLTDPERLEVLLSAWMITAERTRQEALAVPNGFEKEKEQQVGMLESLAEDVREAEPDLEGHRLLLEGSPDWFDHIARRQDARREKLREREEAERAWDEQQEARERDSDALGDLES